MVNIFLQVTVYLSFVSCFLSAWTIVSFTGERWLVVYYPLRKAVWCSRQRTIIILTCSTLFALALYAFLLFIVDVRPLKDGGDVCDTLPDYMGLMYVMTLVDSILTFIVPFSLITLLNACIACKLWFITIHQRHGLFGRDDTFCDTYNATTTPRHRRRNLRGFCSKRNNTQLTSDNLTNNDDKYVKMQLVKCNSNGTGGGETGQGQYSESGQSPTCDTVAVLLPTQLASTRPSITSQPGVAVSPRISLMSTSLESRLNQQQQQNQRKSHTERVSVVSSGGRKKSQTNRQMEYLKSLYEQQAEKRSRQIQVKATRILLIISTGGYADSLAKLFKQYSYIKTHITVYSEVYKFLI